MEKEQKPFIQMNAFKNAVFTLGENTREFTFIELKKMLNFIAEHLETCEHMSHYLNDYKDFLETGLEKSLDSDEENFCDGNSDYEVGENFAIFLNVTDNHKAGKLILKAYGEKFPSHKLRMNAERSYCYVYANDRPEAKRFLEFTYRNYIRPALGPWSEGYEEYLKALEK